MSAPESNVDILYNLVGMYSSTEGHSSSGRLTPSRTEEEEMEEIGLEVPLRVDAASEATDPPDSYLPQRNPESGTEQEGPKLVYDFRRARQVESFLSERDRRLQLFIHMAETTLLPAWTPEREEVEKWGPIGEQIFQHIQSLNIPFTHINKSLRKERPSMLLHNLGSFEEVPFKSARFSQLLETDYHKIFVNTAGSGKTRLMLETLCANWGLYFTCTAADIGSRDLQNTFDSHIKQDDNFQGRLEGAEHFNLRLAVNRAVARRRLGFVLLARLLIMRRFIHLSDARPSMTKLDIRSLQKRWVLLQICPYLLDVPGEDTMTETDYPDIFSDLTSLLHEADNPDVVKQLAQLTALREQRNKDIEATNAEGASQDSRSTLTNEPTEAELTLIEEILKGSVDNIKANISSILLEFGFLFSLFEDMRPGLVYFVDESQDAARVYKESFRSHKGPRRPVLRELAQAWDFQINPDRFYPVIVLTGTGLNLEDIDTAVTSSRLKGRRFFPCCETGAFDRIDDYTAYMRLYIPQYLLQRPEWTELRRRSWYWLHGRYRSLATFIQLLVMDGFRRPHLLLNVFIEHFTGGFIPAEGDRYVDDEMIYEHDPHLRSVPNPSAKHNLAVQKLALLEKVQKLIRVFSCDAMEREGLAISDAVQQIVFVRQMRHGITFQLGTLSDWIQLGLARYHLGPQNTQVVIYDEALPHLAVENWMRVSEHRAIGKFQWYAQRIKSHQPDNNELENLVALYIAHVFGDWQVLGDVFHSLSPGLDGDLLKARARLVAYHRDANGVPYHSPVNSPLDKVASSPSHVLGFSARHSDLVLKWLNHHESALAAPFCFPSTSMGPDILFFLEIRSKNPKKNGVLCAALQCKYREDTKHPMPPGEMIQAISSTSPENFFVGPRSGRKETFESVKDNGNKVQETYLDASHRALDSLTHQMESGAPPHNILRMLCVVPQPIRDDVDISCFEIRRRKKPASSTQPNTDKKGEVSSNARVSDAAGPQLQSNIQHPQQSREMPAGSGVEVMSPAVQGPQGMTSEQRQENNGVQAALNGEVQHSVGQAAHLSTEQRQGVNSSSSIPTVQAQEASEEKKDEQACLYRYLAAGQACKNPAFFLRQDQMWKITAGQKPGYFLKDLFLGRGSVTDNLRLQLRLTEAEETESTRDKRAHFWHDCDSEAVEVEVEVPGGKRVKVESEAEPTNAQNSRNSRNQDFDSDEVMTAAPPINPEPGKSTTMAQAVIQASSSPRKRGGRGTRAARGGTGGTTERQGREVDITEDSRAAHSVVTRHEYGLRSRKKVSYAGMDVEDDAMQE